MTRSTFAILELQRSVIYVFECTLRDKYNYMDIILGVKKILHGSGSVVNFCATEKCYISICMYFGRQIQWCDQNHLWTSSLVSGRSSMDQEGFLNGDQIYLCKFLSYLEVRYISCKYFVRQIQFCGQNYLLTSSLVSGRSSMYQEGFLIDDQNYFFMLKRSVIYQYVCTL